MKLKKYFFTKFNFKLPTAAHPTNWVIYGPLIIDPNYNIS